MHLITNFPLINAAPTIGWLLCVAAKWRPPKANMYFLYNFFHHAYCRPKQWYDALPYALNPARLIINFLPTNAAPTIGLLRCAAAKRQPPKADTPCSFHFLIWPYFTPKTGEPADAPPNPATDALRKTIGSGGTKIQFCGSCCHGDRGQSSWRVGRRRLIFVTVARVLTSTKSR